MRASFLLEAKYVCVHAKKGKHECEAESSYGAAKKAAEHWGLKSTSGIDAHLADKPKTATEGIQGMTPNTQVRGIMPKQRKPYHKHKIKSKHKPNVTEDNNLEAELIKYVKAQGPNKDPGDVLYDIMRSKGPMSDYVSRLYDITAGENGMHGDDDHEDIFYRMVYDLGLEEHVGSKSMLGKVVRETEKRWKQTSMSPQEAIAKYGKENVKVKKGALRNGDDMVSVYVESMNEAGGYYTQPVYDLIEKHGYEKVMHELLTSLHADVIQSFLQRADLEEGGEGSGPKHKEVTVTKDGKSKVVKKIAAKVFTDAGWKIEEGKHGSTEYYRDLDKGQLNHTRSMLMKSAGQLKVAIDQRHKFSKQLMGTGDRAGTGELYKMLETLNELIENWDDKTELYGT